MFNFDEFQNEIENVCRKYRVKKLTAFGSALSDDFCGYIFTITSSIG